MSVEDEPVANDAEPVPVPVRARNPRGQGARLREGLIAATAELLEETGDAASVSVRAIAARAGVSPTALYLHFADRDDLVTAAVQAGFAAFADALGSEVAGHEDAEERLLKMGLAYLAFADRQPALYATIFSARRPAVGEAGEQGDHAFDGLVAALRARDADATEDEVHDLAVAVWSGLHGFAMLSASMRERPGPVDWPSHERFVRRLLPSTG